MARSVSRPLVYRALDQLSERGLARAGATQPGVAGPVRQEYRATPSGRAALRRWRATPVAHLRDVRPELVLKLLLTARAGQDVTALVAAQRDRFAPLRRELAAERAHAVGAARVVAVWRDELAQAAERTLAVLAGEG
jgi:DNA-binding PadR family transcriptional regulator